MLDGRHAPTSDNCECIVATRAGFPDDQNPPRGRSRDRLEIDLHDRVDGVAIELEAFDRNAVGAEVLDGVGAAPRGDDLRQRFLFEQERLPAKDRRNEREAVNGVVRERRLQREGRSEPQPDQRDFAHAGVFPQEFRRLANRRDRGFGRAGAAAVAERIAATGIVEAERRRPSGGETIRKYAPTLVGSERLIAQSRAKHDAAAAAGRLVQPSKTAPKSDGRHADQSVLHQNSTPGSAAAHSNSATLNRGGSAVPI